jgi:hypothetical protein
MAHNDGSSQCNSAAGYSDDMMMRNLASAEYITCVRASCKHSRVGADGSEKLPRFLLSDVLSEMANDFGDNHR